jgi:7-cyano-7-deazaguanine synthase
MSDLRRAVAIVSGGLDSVTLAYLLQAQGYALQLLSFNYGQRHRKEIECARLCAQRLNVPHHEIDLTSLTPLLTGSSLTDAVDVPDGHYAEATMRATVVPNRNAIMLSIAGGVAVARGAEFVAFGAHGGDHFIYPDCRPEFVVTFNAMLRKANEGFGEVQVLAPFLNATKAAIVSKGHGLGVPFGDTWSCYKGGEIHCGECGTCTERREAFTLARLPDPTVYASLVKHGW